jgi:hypothetical protein
MSTSELKNHFYVRVPARVLGCLNSGEITAIFSPGHGLVYARPIPIDWIPFDLRIPNSEFDMLIKFPGVENIRILRKDESCPEIDRIYS